MRTLLALALFSTLQACATSPAGAREHLNLPGRGDALPFSHAVVAGDTVYVAGTLGLQPETRQPPTDPADEARLALDGVRATLRLAGLDMEDLVQIQVFCPDLSLYETFNAVYTTYFEGDFPVRAFVGSGPLLFGCRFEVNGIAVER